MKVIIAGAGIGGLTTALMCHARGIACEVYEQSPSVRELGVGINVLPHAIRELADLDLLEALDRVGVRTRELTYLNRLGQTIWQEPRGIDAGFEVPQFSIHRGRLQAVILEAVKARLGEAHLHTGHHLLAFEQDDAGVSARFADARGEPLTTVRGDVLIGCDGIHSVVRATLYPNEGPPAWNGIMLWRGATDWPVFQDGRSMLIAGGMSAKAVLYPIAASERADHRLLNWAIVVKVSDGRSPPPRREDWSRQGDLAELKPHLHRFAVPQVDIVRLIESTPQFWEYPMCDRDPLPRWSHGRVTLLGDAAHPMYPVGSNGASQAILDARALADCLASGADPVASLLDYQQARLPKTAEIVTNNRRGGPEGVIDAIEALAPDGFDDIERVMSHADREAIVRGYAALAGFTRDQVNRQPAIRP